MMTAAVDSNDLIIVLNALNEVINGLPTSSLGSFSQMAEAQALLDRLEGLAGEDTVVLSPTERGLTASVIHFVIAELDEPEFTTRLGVTKAEARSLEERLVSGA
jgi:hypothetical protein